MAFALWMLIGLLIGWIAQGLVRARGGLPVNLVLGLLGGWVGGLLFRHLSTDPRPGFFGSIGTAAIGAVIFVLLGFVLFLRRR